jgi:hypothetical protein
MYSAGVMRTNTELLRTGMGRSELAVRPLKRLEVLKEIIEKDIDKLARFFKWQFDFLIAGAMLYTAASIPDTLSVSKGAV